MNRPKAIRILKGILYTVGIAFVVFMLSICIWAVYERLHYQNITDELLEYSCQELGQNATTIEEFVMNEPSLNKHWDYLGHTWLVNDKTSYYATKKAIDDFARNNP